MAFADIELRDNGSNTFDIALSGGGGGPTGNSNFLLFFDEPFLLVVIAIASATILW
jgi:hypothetical protein